MNNRLRDLLAKISFLLENTRSKREPRELQVYSFDKMNWSRIQGALAVEE